jgi:hypothetical protein
MCRLVSTRTICTAALLLTANGWSLGQTLKVRPPSEQEAEQAKKDDAPQSPEASPVTVAMSVPSGTPIKVALDSEVRIRSVGQPIHGKTTEPVYAFDKLLVPVGTPVNGTVSAIDTVPKKIRTLEAMDGNLSPVRRVHVQFDELILADGRHLSMQTVASRSTRPRQKRSVPCASKSGKAGQTCKSKSMSPEKCTG